ncbi:unnamed protein product [Amoebophrya sp. A120]|nr:unnamed protein product [Amoebophrya sp. A120]|eukprot:GSA120T00022649001.1
MGDLLQQVDSMGRGDSHKVSDFGGGDSMSSHSPGGGSGYGPSFHNSDVDRSDDGAPAAAARRGTAAPPGAAAEGDDDQPPDGQPRAKRQRKAAENINKEHFKARFHTFKHAENLDCPQAEPMFCALQYSNHILATPVCRSKMEYLLARTASSTVNELSLKENHLTKVDPFSTSLLFEASKIGAFSQRKWHWDMNPLPASHPLGHSKRYTKQQQQQRLVNKQQETEALFLRRPILVQNDIFSKGDDIIVGHEAAEKNLPRKPVEETTPEELLERIKSTFAAVKRPAVHPTDPSIQVKAEYPIVPHETNWVQDFRQVTFDEDVDIKELEEENPSVFWGEQKLAKSFFGLLQPDDRGEHKLDRSYMWVNKGQWEATREDDKAVLWVFPPKKSKMPVKFLPIANKMIMKKMLAQLQTGQSSAHTGFGVGRKRIQWRDRNVAETRRDHKKLAELMPESEDEK